MADETTPGDGPPAEKPKYDQTFFLDLAARGKDAWNAWRRDPANKDVRVTFAGIDFSMAPIDEINFSGFEFGDTVNFTDCKWRAIVWSEIENDPKAFKPGRASFASAVFGSGCRFEGAILGDYASFEHAVFGDIARFECAAFGWWVDFEGAFFKGDVDFSVTSKEQSSKDLLSRLQCGMPDQTRVALERRHEDSWIGSGSRPDKFRTISFAHARFDGEADFSGRIFDADTDFTNARFYYPPDFDAATNHARIDFTGAHVGFVPAGKWLHWTKNSRIPVQLRAFRKIAEETKNHDLERDLYIEERKAERGVYLRQRWEELKKEGWKNWPRNGGRLAIHGFWIFTMFLYWGLADYGRNFLVPAIWLGLSVPFFYWRYDKILAPLMHEAGPANADKYNHAVGMLALGNAVPFVGPLTIDSEIKKFLFCPGFGTCLPIPPEGYQLLVLGQNLLSIILVFFIGLALRNYFKIK